MMKISKELLEKMGEEYRKSQPPDFITHLHYLNCLRHISKGLVISSNLNIKKKMSESEKLSKKIHLLELTLQNINAEYKTILKNPDFAIVCVSWISVKSYYLFFNLLLISKYLITCDEASFFSSHVSIFKYLKKHLEDNKLVFNKKEFNKNFETKTILNWRAKPSAQLKVVKPDIQERFLQIIKKLALYKKEEFKRKEKVKRLVGKKLKYFFSQSTINICEFFYWYRIKANYRDLEFLDKDVSSALFKEFYCSYYELTMQFYKTFRDLINILSKARLGKEILK